VCAHATEPCCSELSLPTANREADDWIGSIHRRKLERQDVLAIAYLLCGSSDLHQTKNDGIIYLYPARKVFGCAYVDKRMRTLLVERGYASHMHKRVLRTVCEVLLYIRDLRLDRLSLEHLQTLVARHRPPRRKVPRQEEAQRPEFKICRDTTESIVADGSGKGTTLKVFPNLTARCTAKSWQASPADRGQDPMEGRAGESNAGRKRPPTPPSSAFSPPSALPSGTADEARPAVCG
jgi:hypothetical protein